MYNVSVRSGRKEKEQVTQGVVVGTYNQLDFPTDSLIKLFDWVTVNWMQIISVLFVIFVYIQNIKGFFVLINWQQNPLNNDIHSNNAPHKKYYNEISTMQTHEKFHWNLSRTEKTSFLRFHKAGIPVFHLHAF